jgi:hypothetical protein
VTRELLFTAHISEDVLEEYAFNRLSEAQMAPLEEHILICRACQEKLGEVDEYIRLMKLAALRPRINSELARPVWAGAIGILLAASAAAVIVGVLINSPRSPVARSAPVELVAFRGGEDMSHASAGRMVDLTIGSSDLPPSSQYRVQLVNADGQEEWIGYATASGAKLVVHVSKTLKRGLHWVRVSSASGELLREFGLRAE